MFMLTCKTLWIYVNKEGLLFTLSSFTIIYKIYSLSGFFSKSWIRSSSSPIVTGTFVHTFSCLWERTLNIGWRRSRRRQCSLVSVDILAIGNSWCSRSRWICCLVEVGVLRGVLWSRWCNLGTRCCWRNRGWWEGTFYWNCRNWRLGRSRGLRLVISCLHRDGCRLNWELRDHSNSVLCHLNVANFEGLI